MDELQKSTQEESAMVKVATFIVDKRNLIFLILIIGLIFSAFSTSWVQVENSLTEYLPDNSETRRGMDVMEDQFITYGTATVMVENISLSRAEELRDELSDITGVQSVTYLEEDHYKNVSALYMVPTYINTYSASAEAIRHTVAKITGKSEFKGTSPVDAFCGRWDTRV